MGKGRISVSKSTIGIWASPFFFDSAYFEARDATASIEIGDGTFINNRAVIVADRCGVKIGKNCLIGFCFTAMDSDFHGLKLEDRTNGNYKCSGVEIGDNVFIGNDVKVLKGVRIGEGAVIGCGSIVVSDVPDFSVYAGVPARFIKNI